MVSANKFADTGFQWHKTDMVGLTDDVRLRG